MSRPGLSGCEFMPDARTRQYIQGRISPRTMCKVTLLGGEFSALTSADPTLDRSLLCVHAPTWHGFPRRTRSSAVRARDLGASRTPQTKPSRSARTIISVSQIHKDPSTLILAQYSIGKAMWQPGEGARAVYPPVGRAETGSRPRRWKHPRRGAAAKPPEARVSQKRLVGHLWLLKRQCIEHRCVVESHGGGWLAF